MDKYEYKVRSDEIRELIAQGEYAEAAQIADTIDWRRVKSVMMLCTISDLYKINRRYEDSRDMLLLAYDRHPGGRTIVYSLCELAIKMGDVVQAVEYYKEFVQVAPKDSGRYILQYKLYEAQDVSLEERIAVLEELKKRDYREKWAYELAYLYHRVGLATRCVEECDELILWFGEGKYVIKAMELKMLHQPLTPQQQEKYDNRFSAEAVQGYENAPKQEPSQETDGEQAYADTYTEDNVDMDEPTKEIPAKEVEIQVQTVDVHNKFNTINLQKELAESMKEILVEPEGVFEMEAEAEPALENMPVSESEEEVPLAEEVFFGETGEIDTTASTVMEQMKQETTESEQACSEYEEYDDSADIEEAESDIQSTEETVQESGAQPQIIPTDNGMLEIKLEAETKTPAVEEYKPSAFEKILGMEYDGQLSLVVPEEEKIEKQITGQLRIEDVLLEWERMKKESEQKRMEAVRKRVLEQTGNLFTEFDAAVKDGLLEQLEGTAEEEAVEEITEEEIDFEDDQVEELEDIQEDISEETAEDISEEEMQEEPEEVFEEEIFEDDLEGEEILEEDIVEDEPVEEEMAEETSKEEDIPEAEIFGEEAVEDDFIEDEMLEEEAEEEKKEEPEEEPEEIRSMTKEEKELFSSFVQSKHSKEQLVQAIDTISLAAYTGNVIVTGEEGTDTLTLAKNLVKNVQMSDSNFSGKMAKITGSALNTKDVSATMDKMKNGALIITQASDMTPATVLKLSKTLEQENHGLIVVLEGAPRAMKRFLKENQELLGSFNARFDLEALDNKSLAEFGRKYAKELEYSIDDLGMLALHTRIADMQTSEHAVTISEVKDIVDEAIAHADRKSIGHFFDILLAKRYDEEDMIILREKDFM